MTPPSPGHPHGSSPLLPKQDFPWPDVEASLHDSAGRPGTLTAEQEDVPQTCSVTPAPTTAPTTSVAQGVGRQHRRAAGKLASCQTALPMGAFSQHLPRSSRPHVSYPGRTLQPGEEMHGSQQPRCLVLGRSAASAHCCLTARGHLLPQLGSMRAWCTGDALNMLAEHCSPGTKMLLEGRDQVHAIAVALSPCTAGLPNIWGRTSLQGRGPMYYRISGSTHGLHHSMPAGAPLSAVTIKCLSTSPIEKVWVTAVMSSLLLRPCSGISLCS